MKDEENIWNDCKPTMNPTRLESNSRAFIKVKSGNSTEYYIDKNNKLFLHYTWVKVASSKVEIEILDCSWKSEVKGLYTLFAASLGRDYRLKFWFEVRITLLFLVYLDVYKRQLQSR